MASTTIHRDASVVVQFRVLKALILRDIRTRFFGNGLGYVVAILWPLTHIALLLVIYSVLGRVPPYGGSVFQFLAIALVPTISYMYMARFMMMSVTMNKPLLNFPIVKLLDLIVARALLEMVTACCCAALLAGILFVLDEPVAPRDPVQAVLAFLSTLLLGFGVGALFGIAASKTPGMMLVALLLNVLTYATSGVLFMPDAMLEEVRYIFSFNPVLHAVEWMREAYYVGYVSMVLDKSYLVGFGAISLVLSLVIERVLRAFLLR